ncbi:hypothetical protein XENORESO_001856 [Xenotaenia resolanae]|uniref:Uncharacterized protein n=1 Tax=Xenotaenia resolanae TaxID=208358 RepID=A0ABV0WLS9_9TELE
MAVYSGWKSPFCLMWPRKAAVSQKSPCYILTLILGSCSPIYQHGSLSVIELLLTGNARRPHLASINLSLPRNNAEGLPGSCGSHGYPANKARQFCSNTFLHV